MKRLEPRPTAPSGQARIRAWRNAPCLESPRRPYLLTQTYVSLTIFWGTIVATRLLFFGIVLLFKQLVN